MNRLHTFVLLLLALSLMAGCATWRSTMEKAGMEYEPVELPRPIRAIWVTRWDYRTEADVRRVIANCARLGATDVIWQVRGQADAFYESDIEPWGHELLEDLPPGVDEPTFDPLELACILAQGRGMRLHAWFNVMPLWRLDEPPASREHLFYTHPEWRLRDAAEQPQPLNDHYVTVNPIFEDVHEYLIGVARDIVRRYPVDGLHLDYIRFVSESAGGDKYPRDAASYAAFRAETGLDAADSPAAYRMFIRERITDLVRGIRSAVKAEKPGLVYSAAVWRDPDTAKLTYLQDYETWLENGWLDLACPMMYTEDAERFARELERTLSVRGKAMMTPGIGVYKHDEAAELAVQMRMTAASVADGAALFAYESFFESANPEQDRSPQARATRKMRREVMAEFWPTRF